MSLSRSRRILQSCFRRRPGPDVRSALVAVLVAGASLAGSERPASALDNGVARTPPMGWDDWNSFGCNVSETLIREMADTIVANGMAAAGYRYVIVDDCWFDPNRDASGNLRGNPPRFPSGMKALGDYLHGKGLKFGIYEVPTARTCAQGVGTYPGSTGSQGHEAQDARTFASWGVDYLKYDWCSSSGTISQQVAAFATMRDALAATGRPIVLSINPNSFHAITGPSRKAGSLFTLHDLWTGALSSTTGAISASVPAHGTVVFRVTGGATTAGSSLVSAASSRCLDDPMSATANGTQPIVWDCSGATNQRWMIIGNTIQVFGKCLDAPLGAVAGNAVTLFDCNGGANQQWTFHDDGSVSGVASGLCLDVTGNQTANGTRVGLWTCTGAGNQRWARE